jgi:hypothetical protein
MHGAHIKIIKAQEAKIWNICTNIQLKLLKTNAAIWFNKMCRTKQLTPKYIRIKVNGGGNNNNNNNTKQEDNNSSN